MKTLEFQRIIWDFYKQKKRNFPWRETTNPYFIFISEVCLQQTQTSRVIEKYQEIIQTFPTVELLGNAPFSEVLSVWSGLGYNRRAKYLHEAAKIIVEQYNGIFPQSIELLDELPGIGLNTAAAIVVYTYNIPHVFIETNIRRIFIHHFFSDRNDVSDSEILPLVSETLDQKNPREWFWALMDYGSFLPKVVTNPNRKSKHYSKQSKFEGSIRQVRGSILKILINENNIDEETLKQKVVGDTRHFDTAVKSLIVEKMVVKKNSVFTLQ